MSDIINDLSGGYFKRDKDKIVPNKIPNTYSIYAQFDDDKEIEVYTHINNEDSMTFVITNTGDEKSYIEFKCLKTGKKFKLYAK